MVITSHGTFMDEVSREVPTGNITEAITKKHGVEADGTPFNIIAVG